MRLTLCYNTFMERPFVQIDWLGRIDYQTAWDLQRRYAGELGAAPADVAQRLLLLEHPPTYTLGRRGKLENLLFDEARLSAEKITVHHVDRGGDITYHGPGQLVGYPIVHLPTVQASDPPDVHLYLRQLEQLIIDTLGGEYGVEAVRFPGYTGVWIQSQPDAELTKIAAIGVKVSARGVTSHGFALNIDPDPTHFAGIVPCGISDHGVAALSDVLGNDTPSVAAVAAAVAARFSNVFQVEVSPLTSYNPQAVAP